MFKFDKKLLFNVLRNLFASLFVITCFGAFVTKPEPPPAPQAEGTGGRNITTTTAKTLMNNYMTWKFTKKTKGGFMSKQVFDQIWQAAPTANGVYWYLGAEVAGQDTVVRIIVESGTATSSAILIDGTSRIFKSASMCPTDCGPSAQ